MPRKTKPQAPVAVVTGGARGIGMAIAERFLADGKRVAILDIDRKTLMATARRLDDPERVLALHCDVSDPKQVKPAIRETARKFGRIDHLVNNAGIAVFKPVLQTSFAEWARVLEVNLGGTFVCSQACAPYMLKAGGGSIVNIASISGLRASTLRVAYGTSKAAIIHITKQFAVELGSCNVRVNCIAPGPVDTAMAKLVHSVAIRQDYYDIIPLNRYGTPEDIAAAAAFLCSDEASYVNGQVLAVDGGFDAMGVGLTTLRKQFMPTTPGGAPK